MLEQIQPTFKNAQGHQYPQAVLAIEDYYGKEEKHTVEVTEFRGKRTDVDAYDHIEQETEVFDHEPEFSSLTYTACYWLTKHEMQQGNLGYIIQGADRSQTFTIEFDEYWIEKYDSIQGTTTQKIFKVCEMHLEEVVLPSLREV